MASFRDRFKRQKDELKEKWSKSEDQSTSTTNALQVQVCGMSGGLNDQSSKINKILLDFTSEIR